MSYGFMEWFFQWLEEHQKVHRHKDWVHPSDRGFYRGWIEAFDRNRVTREEAHKATRNLQETGNPFPDKHLAAVISDVKEQRRLAKAVVAGAAMPGVPVHQQPGFIDSQRQAFDCPECRGDGWARRRMVHAPSGYVATVMLYCRCPPGRYRREVDRQTPDDRARTRDYLFEHNYADLQARPDLWDVTIDHRTWSRRPLPVEHYDTNEAYYLQPGEPVPEGVRGLPVTEASA